MMESSSSRLGKDRYKKNIQIVVFENENECQENGVSGRCRSKQSKMKRDANTDEKREEEHRRLAEVSRIYEAYTASLLDKQSPVLGNYTQAL